MQKENRSYFGINVINKQTKIEINYKIKWIDYLGIKIKNNQEIHCFKLKNLETLYSESSKDNISNYIYNELQFCKDENEVNSKIEEINKHFNDKNNKNNKLKLIGDIGEALFILFSLDYELEDLTLNKYRKSEEETYDFPYSKNLAFDIKTTTQRKKLIKINNTQAKYSHVVVLEVIENSNGININQIYNKIETKVKNKYLSLPTELIDKINFYKKQENQELVSNFKIDAIEKTKIKFINNDELPKIDPDEYKKCKNIIFELETSNYSSDNDLVFDKIKKLIKNN